MPRNGSGLYTLPSPPYPFKAGTTAVAADVDTVLTDLGNGLSASLSADGQTPLSGNLNANGNRVTNLQDPTGAQDAATRNWVALNSFTATGSVATNATVTELDIGSQTMAGSATFVLHSSGSAAQDVILQSTGGTSTSNGQGTLTITAAKVTSLPSATTAADAVRYDQVDHLLFDQSINAGTLRQAITIPQDHYFFTLFCDLASSNNSIGQPDIPFVQVSYDGINFVNTNTYQYALTCTNGTLSASSAGTNHIAIGPNASGLWTIEFGFTDNKLFGVSGQAFNGTPLVGFSGFGTESTSGRIKAIQIGFLGNTISAGRVRMLGSY